jgi:hypothetical protein
LYRFAATTRALASSCADGLYGSLHGVVDAVDVLPAGLLVVDVGLRGEGVVDAVDVLPAGLLVVDVGLRGEGVDGGLMSSAVSSMDGLRYANASVAVAVAAATSWALGVELNKHRRSVTTRHTKIDQI